MKTICIYHSRDLDGWMSAAIVKKAVKHHVLVDLNTNEESGKMIDSPDKLYMLGYDYGQHIPDLSEYDKVIMCDISFPKEEMVNIFNYKQLNFIWIDHHISAIKDLDNGIIKIEGLRDTGFAACELTWKYFFPNEPMPEIVRLLGRYDCFGHKGTDEEQKVLEFQYGARQCISSYEQAYEYLSQCTRIKESEYWRLQAQVVVGQILEQGKSIYSYLCTEAKQVYSKSFEIKLEEEIEYNNDSPVHYNRKFICINKERFNPINFGIDYHKEGYDGTACFWYANGMWNFSLYNDNGLVDCSMIAKQYGGGGHFSASDFRCNNETFLKIIDNDNRRSKG